MNLFSLFRRSDINRELDDFRKTPGAVLLDVRSEEEYLSGHIPQAVNIPLDKISNVQDVVKNHDSAIFVYCLRGTRSLKAAGKLRKLGYTNVKSIGGIASYKGKLEN